MNVRSWLVCLTACSALLLAGCSTTSVSNFTPRTVPSNPSRMYSFEASWDSMRRGVKPEDVQAWVDMDGQLYPMTRVPVARNRWEAAIPISDGRSYVAYKYRFDFKYPGVTTRHVESVWSPEYRLVIPSGNPQ
ncbi:MAG: hypothetical protein WCR07_04485 [Verrucomicrobiota bacterium]|jgi:hypothetical protein